MYKSEKNKLDKFILLRNKYIDMLESKQISKIEFNHLNNQIFQNLNLRPFTVLDSFEKALYNYNYYNSRAKICLEECNKYKNLGNLKKAKIADNNKINNYYHKDNSIIYMLEFENSEDVKAYYVHMNSKSLSDQIFEIHFEKRDRVILHSKNKIIKDLLLKKNCFLDEVKESLISEYINK